MGGTGAESAQRANEWAVVTGASGGIGRGFAERLARDGMNVLLVARSARQLEELADELRTSHGVQVEVDVCDLADAADRGRLVASLADRPVGILVNNAGFNTVGDFVDADPARMADEITLNCLAVTELARAVAPGMKQRGRGAIVNLASTASFQPLPTMAVYAATKAYVRSWSEALWHELRPYGVTVQALCPGSTATRFWIEAGDDHVLTRRRTVEQVVDTSIRALKTGEPVVVDGLSNAVLARLAAFTPLRLKLPLARWTVSPRR